MKQFNKGIWSNERSYFGQFLSVQGATFIREWWNLPKILQQVCHLWRNWKHQESVTFRPMLLPECIKKYIYFRVWFLSDSKWTLKYRADRARRHWAPVQFLSTQRLLEFFFLWGQPTGLKLLNHLCFFFPSDSLMPESLINSPHFFPSSFILK